MEISWKYKIVAKNFCRSYTFLDRIKWINKNETKLITYDKGRNSMFNIKKENQGDTRNWRIPLFMCCKITKDGISSKEDNQKKAGSSKKTFHTEAKPAGIWRSSWNQKCILNVFVWSVANEYEFESWSYRIRWKYDGLKRFGTKNLQYYLKRSKTCSHIL